MRTVKKSDWEKYFPFEKSRQQQDEAINFAINSFIAGYKYVLLELPTGVGKSAVGITVARYLNQNYPTHEKDEEGNFLTGTYFLSTQRLLVDQYTRDFKALIRTIKSSSNYRCQFYNDQTCAESKRLLAKLGKQLNGTEFQKQCKNNCTYSIEKQDFIESPLSVTNFAYFLTESSYSGKLTPRDLLVIDECHNIENELGKFIEVTFSEKFAKEILKCKLPKSELQDDIFDWIRTAYRKSINKYARELEKTLSKISQDGESCGDHSKRYEMIENHIGKIDKFVEIYHASNWSMNIKYTGDNYRTKFKKFEFKPIDISQYNSSLFRMGTKALMMSATVVSKEVFCNSIGLKPEDVAYLRMSAPFRVENHPIHYLPAGSMSKDKIDQTLPVLAKTISMLLEKHADVKGVIHAVNYKIANYIFKNVETDRLLIHETHNRDEILKRHYASKDPTVLLSPSMSEGVDLADDASRFQILCKIPYPYLGDLVVKKRMEKNKLWYPYATSKTIIQAFGRSIRNESDHAVSYILDADWERFYSLNREMLPDNIRLSLK